MQWWATVVGIIVAVERLGDQPRAATLYDLLTPYSERICTLGQAALYGATAYFLGLLAITLERWDEAVTHLGEAIARHEAVRSPPLIALAQSALGTALEARGRPEDGPEAKRLRQQATMLATTLGMGPLERRSLSGGDRMR
jgi:hypothetical protein